MAVKNPHFLRFCSACHTQLSSAQILGSDGVCPHCGHRKDGTVVAHYKAYYRVFWEKGPWWMLGRKVARKVFFEPAETEKRQPRRRKTHASPSMPEHNKDRRVEAVTPRDHPKVSVLADRRQARA